MDFKLKQPTEISGLPRLDYAPQCCFINSILLSLIYLPNFCFHIKSEKIGPLLKNLRDLIESINEKNNIVGSHQSFINFFSKCLHFTFFIFLIFKIKFKNRIEFSFRWKFSRRSL